MSSLAETTWQDLLRDWISSPVGIAVLVCILSVMAYLKSYREHPTYDREDYDNAGHVKFPQPLQDLRLTKEELGNYNAYNPDGKYLIALQGILYDVSCAPQDFGPRGQYKTLSGTDIMKYLHKTSRYEVRDFETFVSEWKKMLEDRFHVAGIMLQVDQADADDSTDSISASDASTVYESTNDCKTEPEADQTYYWNDTDNTIVMQPKTLIEQTSN